MPTPVGQGSLLQSREQVQHPNLMGETLREDQGGVGAETRLPQGGRFMCDSGALRVKSSPRKAGTHHHHREDLGVLGSSKPTNIRLPNANVLCGE